MDWKGNMGAAVESSHNSSKKSADSYKPPVGSQSARSVPNPNKAGEPGCGHDWRGVKPESHRPSGS